MLIDIERLSSEGLRVDRDFDFMSVDLVEENAVFLEPAHADLVVRKLGSEIQVKGKITSRLSFVCSRCLSPFEFPVDSHFDLIYLPEEFHVEKDELEEEDIEQCFYSGTSIDLSEIILEQLNLIFPLKPLCSEDCEGICAVCGKIRKDGLCRCTGEEAAPRLNKLKNFIKR